MTDLSNYPGVTSFKDRHGRERFRYRRKGVARAIPGRPGERIFEAAYKAVIEGRRFEKAKVVSMPRAVAPRSLAAAWGIVKRSPEWQLHRPATQSKDASLAEEFLAMPVVEGKDVVWRDITVDQIKRRHIKTILAAHIDTPHKAKHMLVVIRKMIYAAMDEDWIETDPTVRIRWRPKHIGWRAWRPEELSAFMERWPAGSTPRTVFTIALWLGLRRGDTVKLRWDQIDFVEERVTTDIIKGGKRAILKMSPMLIQDLMAVNRRGEQVLVTEYGRPFSDKSLTNNMAEWTAKAGLEAGCTIHGLRKTLGKLAAEGGATTRQAMDLLTHDNIAHAELYSRAADQERLAAAALDCAVVAFEKYQKRRAG